LTRDISARLSQAKCAPGVNSERRSKSSKKGAGRLWNASKSRLTETESSKNIIQVCAASFDMKRKRKNKKQTKPNVDKSMVLGNDWSIIAKLLGIRKENNP
jgi:hypothetical protein